METSLELGSNHEYFIGIQLAFPERHLHQAFDRDERPIYSTAS
jgi:hypothetical protein